MDIDLVITYVDSSDPRWLKDYEHTCRALRHDFDKRSARFREWNTLKYIMRGTERCMPWVRNVHLIVERPSQVPGWVRRDRVNIVLHPFVIPRKYLPTYNSTCIEQFMWRIPGLSEHFLYANDDMIPVNPLSPEDFFDDKGNPKLEQVLKGYHPQMGMYSHHLHNGENLIRRLLSLPPRRSGVIRTGHNISPMLVSTWAMLWGKAGRDIRRSLSTFRSANNINQELAAYWHLLTDNYSQSERTAAYMELGDVDKVCEAITGTGAQLICINDARCANYKYAKARITEAFNKKFPDKSKYEL